MEFINKQIVQIREYLRHLSASQQLLFAMIIVVMAISLIWLVYLTAKPEMISLIDQPMSDTEVASIQNRLDQWDVFYRVQDGRILVKRQDRDRLIARLQMDRALPADLSESWRKLVLESDMWLPQEDRQRRWQMAKEQRLAQIIQHMDRVQQAHVIINTGSKRLLSDGPNSDPSASVSIQMQAGAKPSQALVLGIAELVSGSVDRLTRERVNIVADGAYYKVPSETSPFTSDVLDARRKYESHFSDTIQQVLGVPSALVGVFVELETQKVHTETRQFSGEPAIKRESIRESTTEQLLATGEPGVRPNTGASVAGGASGGERSAQTESEVEFTSDRDMVHTIMQNLPGAVKSIRASVNVPYSYFVEIYHRQTGTTETPKIEELETIIDIETAKIQRKVIPIINAVAPEDVVVSYYYDLSPEGVSTALASGGTVSVPHLLEYGKPAGLIFLAFGSLAMVLMMLKKASGTVGVSGLERTLAAEVFTPDLESDSAPVGEAGGSEGVLEGIEVDEETLRTRKMAEQVATMVKEDPASAASLVRQWIIKKR